MIGCYLRYQIDPDKIAEFEAYCAMWLDLLPRFGGAHHGYFLPSEGESDVALAMFSLPSLAAYEQYRKDAAADPDAQKARREAVAPRDHVGQSCALSRKACAIRPRRGSGHPL